MAISKIVYKENSSATPVVWMDATTATAAAADIASPKTAMLADGVVTTGTGTDGGGGGSSSDSNIITGKFTGTTQGAGLAVTIPYTGSGYPVAVVIYPSVGVNKSGSAMSSLVKKQAIILYCAVKDDISSVPTYTSSTDASTASVSAIYKNSDSDASVTAGNRYIGATFYRTYSVSNGLDSIVRFSNSTTMNVYIPSANQAEYGFAANIEYTYQIVYSSYGGSVLYVWQDSEGYIHLAPEGENVTAPEKWVNFIDYNGDILYSYTKSEIANLTALPDNPSHSGLVSQGWNWTLEEIQSEVLAGTTKIWVGQSYGTVSGATEIDVEFNDPDYLSPYLQLNLTGTTGVTIDWGDGSTPTSDSTAGSHYYQHTFPSVGKYTIKISISDDTKWYYFYNTQGNNHCSILLAVAEMNDTSRSMVYANAIKAIRVGDNFYMYHGSFRTLNNVEYITIPNTIRNVGNPTEYKIGYFPFAQCPSLKSVTLPHGVIINSSSYSAFDGCYTIKNVSIPASISIDTSGFYIYCRGLAHPYIPSGTTAIPNNCFSNCMSIIDLVLPSDLTTIGNGAFNTCQSLTEITIPASVTSIGTDAFRYNYGLMAYHFLPTTPPTLGNSTVFGGIHANCKIYVPAASVNAYKTATNWSTYADYIEAEPT